MGWWQLPKLGRTNVHNLIQLAQNTLTHRYNAQEPTDELRRLRPSLERLKAITSDDLKPLLPGLRSECFNLGDAVSIYLGDTPEASVQGWVDAEVISIEKAHKMEWVNYAPLSGYYWRIVAQADCELLAGSAQVAFSTSEPRVLRRWELDWLRQSSDEVFLCTFAINATRDWSPIWCLERGHHHQPGHRYRDWLVASHPG
ncbi:MAG: hypothetical protein AAFS10_13380 [Myxococcota bacterium]